MLQKIALFLLLLTVAACGAAKLDSDQESNRLVIYSGRSESLVGPLIAQFEEASGIDVVVRYGDTAELAALLLEEGDRSPADLFYAQDPAGLGAVQNAGLLAPLPQPLIDLVPARFVDNDGEWIGVSGRARVVVYNTELIGDPASALPTDIRGFTDPAWRGRIGWAPTNGSFQAMVSAMRAVWGDAATREWLQGIQANEPIVYEKNTPIVAAVAAGEVEVGFVNHYYLYRFLAEEGESFPARNYFLPGGGPGSLIMVSGAGVLESAAHAEKAQEFVEFLLSNQAQQYFANETFEYPVVDGVATVTGLTPLAAIDAQAIKLNVNEYDDLAGTVEMLSEVGILP